jgi:hypothetical protein
MLKMASSGVLGSSKSSTYPGGYASGFDSPAALLEDHFEHPRRKGRKENRRQVSTRNQTFDLMT